MRLNGANFAKNGVYGSWLESVDSFGKIGHPVSSSLVNS